MKSGRSDAGTGAQRLAHRRVVRREPRARRDPAVAPAGACSTHTDARAIGGNARMRSVVDLARHRVVFRYADDAYRRCDMTPIRRAIKLDSPSGPKRSARSKPSS
jgi:hypothetical protein